MCSESIGHLMKAILVNAAIFAMLSGSAFAADLPNVKGPPIFTPPPPVFTWTGLYVGGQVGYEWGTSDPNAVFVATGAPVFGAVIPFYNDEGVVGGAHVGYNYQINQFVLGLEGDVEGSSYSGSGTGYFPPGKVFTDTTRIPIDGSIRGRVGIVWDRVLVYGTGGVAFASIRNTLTPANIATAFDAADTGRVGWTAGGGVEYAIDPNWSVRIEYRYTDYGTYDFVLVNNSGFGGDTVALRELERDNRVEAGFSYKFDLLPPPTPVVAKY